MNVRVMPVRASRMIVLSSIGSMNRYFTQECPGRPGFPVPRILPFAPAIDRMHVNMKV